MQARQEHTKLYLSYQEPTTNADGTPLTDLGGTIISLTVNDSIHDTIEVAATSAKGGGTIEQRIPIGVDPDTRPVVRIDVRAFDTHVNVSEPHTTALTFEGIPPGPVI